jgi:hypothetical protein
LNFESNRYGKVRRSCSFERNKTYLNQNWNANRIYNPGILAFTHIVLHNYEASASTFRTCL